LKAAADAAAALAARDQWAADEKDDAERAAAGQGLGFRV
jgi:hypothetical protein